ncbi:MAG: hypothetical protein Kow00124_15790 [Anaerolineae bacterium]
MNLALLDRQVDALQYLLALNGHMEVAYLKGYGHRLSASQFITWIYAQQARAEARVMRSQQVTRIVSRAYGRVNYYDKYLDY